MNNAFSQKKVIAAVLLIALGVSGRLLIDIPNFETITVAALLAGSLLGGPWIALVGLLSVAISDIWIGNELILLYTWSAWSVMGLFGWILRKRNTKPLRHALELTGTGMLAHLFFYAWTNFGVWHIGHLYPHTLNGLMASYIAGLPFLKYSLISTALFVPTLSFIAVLAWRALPQRSHTAATSPVVLK